MRTGCGLCAMICLAGFLLSCSRQATAPNGAAVEAQAEQFVREVVQGDFSGAMARFDDHMANAMPADKLRETWRAVVTEVGEFERIAATRLEKAPPHDIAFLTCEFEKQTLDLKLVFASSGKISGMWFVPSQAAAQ